MFLRIPKGIALGIVAHTAPEKLFIGNPVCNLCSRFVKAGAERRLDHVVAENGARIGLHMQRIAVTAVVLFGDGMGGVVRRTRGADDEAECQHVPPFPAGKVRRERLIGRVSSGVFPPAVCGKVFPAAGIRCQVLRRAGQEDFRRVAEIV